MTAAGGMPRRVPVALDASGRALVDLSGVAEFTVLRELNLADNAVSDAGPLQGLAQLVRLRWVWLADNPLRERPGAILPARAWTDIEREVPAVPERNDDL